MKGVDWSSRYGYVGITALGMPYVCDGLNDQGLSVAYPWLVGTTYPDQVLEKPNLSLELFSDWALGNFKTVDEVEQALTGVNPALSNKLLAVIPLPVALHDAQGNSAVIEFIDGRVRFYHNPNGILTNDPPFDWQQTSLGYYKKKLSAVDPGVAVPGEFFSAERFIRATVVRDALPAASDPMTAASRGLQILSLVAPPYGMPGINSTRGLAGIGVKYDYTQWSLIRDHVHRVLYYRTADNPGLRAVDLKTLDFSGKTQYDPIPLGTGAWFAPAPLPSR